MKSKLKWGTRWLSPKAKVVNSKVHGLGVQATKLIKKGEAVGVLGGLVVPRKKVREYWKLEGHVGIQISDDFYIVPPNRSELKKYGVYNHSCEPNIGFRSESNIFYAIKDIKPGEELCFDYAFCELDKPAFKCECGTKSCRGKVTPNDWKNKVIQKKYGKYFSPFVKAKIK